MVGNEMFKDAHELVARERYGRRWAVDRVSFDGPSPGHSAGEGARDDFGDGRHVGIGFPGGQQSALSCWQDQPKPPKPNPRRAEPPSSSLSGRRGCACWRTMQQCTRGTKGSAMLSWLRRRRERAERIDAQVKALIRAFGVDAHYEARQRQRGAESAEAAQEWRAVARAIARKTGSRLGLDTATRMAMDADFSTARQRDVQRTAVVQRSEARHI
jgi:hypothetical protein